jgi:hypothetical protein
MSRTATTTHVTTSAGKIGATSQAAIRTPRQTTTTVVIAPVIR